MKNPSKNNNKIINSAEKLIIDLLMHGGNKGSYMLKQTHS